MNRILMALIAVMMLCGFAKATVGKNFNDANLPQLVIGATTLEEATALLGAPPLQSTVGGSGAIAHTWSFVQSKASMFSGNVSSSSKSVTLVFGTDGKFQRVLRLNGITLDAATFQRLVSDPAAAAASATAAAGES